MSEYSEPLYDRIYVDEVQDITQAEIGLFFLVSGLHPDSLFLAGDPAQAVSQGVDFRFEEVRSVVHMITDGKQRVERWQKLHQNFRSHEGILKVAGVVLDRLHQAFPNAAVKLSPDMGLVQGPRPGLLKISLCDIGKLLEANERITVLVRDRVAEDMKSHFPKSVFAFYGIIGKRSSEQAWLSVATVILTNFLVVIAAHLPQRQKDSSSPMC